MSAPQGDRRSVRMIVASVMLAVLVAPLNSTMIAVALPAVTRDYGVSAASGTWLVTVYLIAMASLMPVAGKLGDRYGRRPVMLAGLVLFLLASAGAIVAPAWVVLIVARVGQAAGASVIMPNGLAILRESVAPQKLGTTIGVVGIAAPLAAAAGPPVGSLLLQFAGWRALFAINLPLLVAPLAVGWFVFPREAHPGRGPRFDVAGAVLVCVVLIAFTRLLDLPGTGWLTAVWVVALCVAGFVLVRQERRHPDPAVAPGLFTNPRFTAAAAGVLLSNFAMYGTLLALPLLLAHRPGWPVAATGGVLAAMMGAVAALAPLGGWLGDRFGHRPPVLAGLAILTCGMATLAVVGAQLSPAGLAGTLAAAGVGIGLANPGLQTSAVQAVAAEQTGMASGVYATCRYFGSITCSALLAGPFAATTTSASGFTAPFLTYAAAGVAAVAVMALFPLLRRTRPATDTAPQPSTTP